MTSDASPPPMDEEQREFNRVSDVLPFQYGIVDEALVSAPELGGSQPELFFLTSEFNQIQHELKLLHRQAAADSSAIAKYIGRIDLKLQRIFQVLLLKEMRHDGNLWQTVNMSAEGVSFEVDQPISPGTQLDIRLVLPAMNAGLKVLGRVVRCGPVGKNGRRHVGVRFVDLRETDKELIVQYVLRREAEILRERRGYHDDDSSSYNGPRPA
ncbi:MAG: PilZ domain-containing protein [Pseudomonadota bacterium]|nr:PilZ domain-containing protein [Pseudomonadota bacterium]